MFKALLNICSMAERRMTLRASTYPIACKSTRLNPVLKTNYCSTHMKARDMKASWTK
jgi:hypothetical protein